MADKSSCIGTADDGTPRLWVLPIDNFDNLMNAFLTLINLSTTTTWIDAMHSAMDSTGIDSQPSLNASPYYALYFVVFIIVGVFFLMNMLSPWHVSIMLSHSSVVQVYLSFDRQLLQAFERTAGAKFALVGRATEMG